VLLYKMCSGRYPVEGKNIHALVYNLINGEVTPPLDEISSAEKKLNEIIMGLLSKKAKDRPVAIDVCKQLKNFIDEQKSKVVNIL